MRNLTKNKNSLHFLLVPDAGAARRLRRLLCADRARTGVVVGTWGELLERARADYLLPPVSDDWEAAMLTAMRALSDAFWSRSLEVAPGESAAAVASAFEQLIQSAKPDADLRIDAAALLPSRPRQHLTDLLRLRDQLEGRLPPDLETIRALLAFQAEDAIRHTCVYTVASKPWMSVWQQATVDKLNADAAEEHDDELQRCLETALLPCSSGAQGTQLENLQTALYSGGDPRPLDTTTQWVGVRDSRQEAEVAAGMAQQLIAAGSTPAEIGLLMPADERYYDVVRQSFTYAGLPLSGLPQPEIQRDLGFETIFNFLVCRQRPAPGMAVAAFVSSPLMPWPRATGNWLARKIMEGDYELRLQDNADHKATAILKILQAADDSSQALASDLSELGGLLCDDERLEIHRARALEAIALLSERLSTMPRPDWRSLRSAVSPSPLAISEEANFTLEGITVWLEHQSPWRPVKHLIVLDFSDRHYPKLASYSPVFFQENLRAINAAYGIELDTNDALLERRRSLFKSQLTMVHDSVAFLIPRRDGHGDDLTPASSLLFMASLCAGIKEPDDLVLDIESTSARERIRNLAVAARATATSSRELSIEHLSLGRNLLELRADEEGNAAPQSPSRLENLIVSPFAWLLAQLRAEPVEWAPDELDVLLKGSIAHDVFEVLFRKDEHIPTEEVIRERLADDYTSILRRRAPFMRSPSWHVERRHLRNEILEAALAWREILTGLNAVVVDSEFWLVGTLDAHRIHGQVDTLLALPENRLLVIDFKKSSASSRRDRMDKGYDSQASLYRRMLETGGPKGDGTESIGAIIKSAQSIGVGYFTMNDRRMLADQLVSGAERLPGWVTFDNPVSANAMELLRERLLQVSDGRILLNETGDEKSFNRSMGIKPYALDNSPLIRIFTRPDGSGGVL